MASSYRSLTVGLILLSILVIIVAAGGSASLDTDVVPRRTYPSMPAAVAARPPTAREGQKPVFIPINSSHYEHRKGHFEVQVPEGAHDISLTLRHHDDFVFGTAMNPEMVPAADLDWYLDMTRRMFNGLTPEDRFKWFNFEVKPGQYQQSRQKLDSRYIAFAKAANFSLARGHTLEWAASTGFPNPWFWAHRLECDAYVVALKERVTRDVKLYKGKFNQYDVFNEIIESPGMLEKCNLWDTAFPQAFKWAHEADPDAQLCINDLSLIEAHNAPRLIEIIKNHVWAHDAPIHCIGIQAHFEHYGINMTHQQEKLDLLATLGLRLYITEYTMFTTWTGPPVLPDHPGAWPVNDLDEETHAHATVELFRLWFSHPAVKGIIMWGWWDATIWIPNAGIYTKDRQPKKTAVALQDLWQRELYTTAGFSQPETQTVAFKGFYGDYNVQYTTKDGQRVEGVVSLVRGSPNQQALVAPAA